MIRKIEEYCKRNEIIKKDDKIVIGLSGGADSVCLFFILLNLQKKYGLSLQAVHIHHKIRRQEADRDAVFAEKLCSRYQIPCIVEYHDVLLMAKKEGISEEEAGRKVRYTALERIRIRLGFTKIAVAHHIKDQAETILFHLCRGSGLAGLRGMCPVSGVLIRPLLSVSRREIEDYLRERNQSWCTDSTNLENHYMRNRLRNQVLPLLTEQVNAEAVEHIAAAGTILGEAYAYIRTEAQCQAERLLSVKKTGEIELDVKETVLLAPVIRREVYRILLEKKGGLHNITALHLEQMDDIVNGQVGRRIDLPGERKAVRTYQALMLLDKKNAKMREKNDDTLPVLLTPGERYILSSGETLDLGMPEEIEQFCRKSTINREKIMEENLYTKCFDYDKIKDTLMLRTRQEGDYLELGAGLGSKTLKKYFIDKKIPKEERDSILLIADGSHILWIIGYRISAGYKVTEDTRTILQIKISGGQKDGR